MCYCRTLHVLHLTRPTSLITCISYRRTTLLTAGTYPSCVPSAWYNAWHLRDRKNSMTETFKSKAADVKGMEERGTGWWRKVLKTTEESSKPYIIPWNWNKEGWRWTRREVLLKYCFFWWSDMCNNCWERAKEPRDAKEKDWQVTLREGSEEMCKPVMMEELSKLGKKRKQGVKWQKGVSVKKMLEVRWPKFSQAKLLGGPPTRTKILRIPPRVRKWSLQRVTGCACYLVRAAHGISSWHTLHRGRFLSEAIGEIWKLG